MVLNFIKTIIVPNATGPEFFLLAHCVRCGGDSFSYADYSVKGHAVILASHPQTPRNPRRKERSG
ncbi:MAG: hypothetical protein QMB82_02100 [Bacteroidales bacterium]